MRFAVIYESIYGNTGAIADAVARGLKEYGDVLLAAVEDADTTADVLVLGAPTHAHGLPSRASRSGLEEEARKKIEAGETLDYQPTAGIRALIADLPKGADAKVACFDTRFDKSVILTGSAAKTMAKKLGKLGYEVLTPPKSFFVLDIDGPLKDGELDRAEDWGAAIGEAAVASS